MLAYENERVGKEGREGGRRKREGREGEGEGWGEARDASRRRHAKVGSADLSGLPATREAPARRPSRPPRAHTPASAHAAGSDPVSPTVERIEAGHGAHRRRGTWHGAGRGADRGPSGLRRRSGLPVRVLRSAPVPRSDSDLILRGP